jgi:hypothetical protein
VIAITDNLSKLRSDARNIGASMPDKFAESTARLERLIAEVMKEEDPTRYDKLCEEIWLVLAERELLESQLRAVQSERPKAA